jgi:NADH:ubiquinone reductase (H+-translocating)
MALPAEAIHTSANRHREAADMKIADALRGQPPKNYIHHNLGLAATLGLRRGILESGPVLIKGLPAWWMHRGYHALAVPTWQRMIRVLADWPPALVLGGVILFLQSVQDPRRVLIIGGSLDVRR